MYRRCVLLATECLALLVFSGCGQQNDRRQTPPVGGRDDAAETNSHRDLASAALALQRNDLDAAELAVQRHLVRDPSDVRALQLFGDIASRRGDSESAINAYQAVVDQSEPPAESLMEELAVQLISAGRGYEALGVLQERTELYPASVPARFDFVELATMLGLPHQAVPSLRWLCQHGHSDAESLQVLADPEGVKPNRELCQTLLERCPGDLRPEFGLALLDAHQLRWSKAVERLQRVIRQHEDFVPAFTLYGLALTELNEFDELAQWRQRAPENAESSAEFWLVAGLWAQHHRKYDRAARAFWEAIRRDDIGNHRALTNLAICLRQLGREQDAQKVADQLTKYVALWDAIKTHLERSSKSQRSAMRIADAMADLGRIWEAEGWARMAVGLQEDRIPEIRGRYMAIRSQLTANTSWQLSEMVIGRSVDLSDLPVPDWIPAVSPKTPRETFTRGNLRFEDEAQLRGWTHTCEITSQDAEQGYWIHQTLAGGVAVIDFDLDGWPDLAAAMLNGKALQSDSSPNRLFRNLAGQFRECTVPANYRDTGFGQGIAVGDFNDDGFPDIFDANIGRNRLYRNNGDGTFEEVSAEIGLSGQAWTTSAALVDIDADGFADLFETAYCSGREPYDQPCRNRQGVISTCPPLDFEAELDHVWRGTGDGRFVDVTDQWMQQSSPGRGLGVLAGLFDERPGLDLYVANDMTVNHLWSGSADGDHFQLTDLGAVRGVGLSGRSTSQASMGMAAGDPDGDGDIDFFLTHFTDDHNTFYEQVGPGLWADRSFPVGLSEPSMKMLGFGAEWVDFDNNGKLDLIIVNGHVVDFDHKDILFEMPAQLFSQDSTGRWIELDRKELGDYFASNHLGRALATIDVDRDGRVDVAVTHLFEPVSLLMNRTTQCGRSIHLELKSTRGQRDAIGATVTTTFGNREVAAQLTAGDGFMCSNQRFISLGARNATEAQNLTVVWPSGVKEVFGTVATGNEYLLVEGSGKAFPLQRLQ